MHESDPTLYRYPATLPSLSRADYPRLIGGCSTTDPILLPAFQNSFSPERKLRSWSFCGAVPLTRAALKNPSVRHELSHNASDIDTATDEFVPMEAFDWKKATLLDLERENGAACRKLELLGFEAKPLQLKAPRAPTRLNANRVAIDAPEAEKVRALAGNNNMWLKRK